MTDSRQAAWWGDPGTWHRIRDVLRRELGERNFETWIAPLRPTWPIGALRLEAPDAATRDRVERHFAGAIDGALREVGIDARLCIEVASEPVALPVRARPPAAAHTFGTFVVGESNAPAYRAAQALADGETRLVFLHGPSGVGKTHLLHAAGHELTARGLRMACLPAADLVAAMVGALSTRTDDAFWRELSPLRVLLLDDLHSLSGRDEMQERLMDGLATWMENGRLLALTSDRPPDDMPRLTAAVRAHCAGGLVAGMGRPEPSLRAAILERKAEASGITLDRALATRLASAIGGNVRRLEGALTRLLAHARLYGRRIDEALATEVLPELRHRASSLPSVATIVDATAAAFGVRARMVLGRSRRPELVLPRQVAMYLARRLLRRPFPELAAEFGRDHTTVMHAARQVAARLGVDAALTRLVAEIERRLDASVG